MKVLFDNCTSPILATTMHGFIQHEGHSAFHIRDVADLPNGRHSKDIEWIDLLRRSNDVWIFISGDGRVLKLCGEGGAPVRWTSWIYPGAGLSKDVNASGRLYTHLEMA